MQLRKPARLFPRLSLRNVGHAGPEGAEICEALLLRSS